MKQADKKIASEMRWEIYEYLTSAQAVLVAQSYRKWEKLGYSTVESLFEDVVVQLAGPVGGTGAFEKIPDGVGLLGEDRDAEFVSKLNSAAAQSMDFACRKYNERRHARHTEDGLEGAATIAAVDVSDSAEMRELHQMIEKSRHEVRKVAIGRILGLKPRELKSQMSRRQYNMGKKGADALLMSWAQSARQRAAAFATAIFAIFRPRGDKAAEAASAAGAAGTGGAAVAAGGGIALGGKAATACIVVCLGVGAGGVAIKKADDAPKKAKSSKAASAAPLVGISPRQQAEVDERAAAKRARERAAAKRRAEARRRAREKEQTVVPQTTPTPVQTQAAAPVTPSDAGQSEFSPGR